MRKRSGKVTETIIDTTDLQMMHDYPGTWSTTYSPYTRSFYVVGNFKNKEGKFKSKGLHRYLMGDPKGYEIDHFNHNTLDNRRSCNLEKRTKSLNQQNRLGANKNSTSGHRGVSFHKGSGKWRSHAKVDGAKIHLGYFENMSSAVKAAKKFRKEKMKNSQESFEVI